jgi:hypothetical protein
MSSWQAPAQQAWPAVWQPTGGLQSVQELAPDTAQLCTPPGAQRTSSSWHWSLQPPLPPEAVEDEVEEDAAPDPPLPAVPPEVLDVLEEVELSFSVSSQPICADMMLEPSKQYEAGTSQEARGKHRFGALMRRSLTPRLPLR